MFRPAYLSLIIGVLFASVVLAQSTDDAEPYPIRDANLNLTEADEGGAFELRRIGDEFVVVLEGNPTTGYLWEVEAVDESILQQVGESEFLSDSKVPGSGGKLTLVFRAMAPGQTTLRLVYHRPWEEDVEPLKTYEVNVVVQPHSSLSYQAWLECYAFDMNQDGQVDETDYQLWVETPIDPVRPPDIPDHLPVDETPAEDSMSYEEWLDHYGDDLNDDGVADEADYELWKENPYIGIPTPTAVSTQSWGAIKKAVSR